jgi:beta-lactamase class A
MFTRRRNRRRNNSNRSVFLAGFGIILALVVYLVIFQGTLPSLSPSAYFPTPTPTQIPPNPLKPIVQNQLQDAKGTYAVVIKNMENGISYSYNEHKVFDSASLYKAWVMAVIYEKIEEGKLREDEVLEKDIAELNKEFGIPAEVAEQTAGTTKYTVNDALRKMISISDNYASLLLTDEVTYDGLDFFLIKYGLNESKTGQGEGVPQTSAHDAARFYELLYTGKLANKENTRKMIELLKTNEFKTIIPKYIPVEVSHKTGALDEFSHDAGIVFTPKTDYVIALLSESGVPPAAEERMARISENTYQYFQTLPDPEPPPKDYSFIWKWLLGIVSAVIVGWAGFNYWKKKKTEKKHIF